MRHISIKWRMTLWFTVVMVTISALVLVFVMLMNRNSVTRPPEARHLLRHRRRPRAAQQAPVLVVDLGVHPVAVELHVAEIPVPVVKFQIVGVALHHVHHLRLRRAGDGAWAGC